MNVKQIEKIIRILSNLEKTEGGYHLSEKDRDYILSVLHKEAVRRQERKNKQPDSRVKELIDLIGEKESRFVNPVDYRRLAVEIKGILLPFMDRKGWSVQHVKELLEFFLSERLSGWLKGKKDAHLFVRFIGEVERQYKEGKKPSFKLQGVRTLNL